MANYHSFKLKANGSYKIPIVVHVMETKTSMTEISDEQIYKAIQYLNEVYRKVAGTHGDGNGVDLTIEFALAVRDPQGNCTTGITRRDMSSNAKYMAAGTTSNTTGISDATLKTFDVWDQTKYYNIWLVSEIDGISSSPGKRCRDVTPNNFNLFALYRGIDPLIDAKNKSMRSSDTSIMIVISPLEAP